MSERRSESVRLPLPAGGALQVYLSYRDSPAETAIAYVHGFGSSRLGEKSAAFEAVCVRRGWTYASFDFRGHGESTGTLLELRGTLLLEDVEALQAYLSTRGVTRLCLVGSSMGGWAAAWSALRHPSTATACVLIAPAIDFLRSRWALLTEPERELWQRTGRLHIQSQWVTGELGYGIVEDIPLFPMERLAAELARPTLILHGLQDDVVPLSQSLAFLERAAFPEIELHIYKDGDHRLLRYKDEMAEAAGRFFARHANLQ
jgi:uncharacterized protein